MDLTLTEGDLTAVPTQTSYSGVTFYDLQLDDTSTFTNNLINRTLLTPLGYLGLWTTNNQQIVEMDNGYGNPLYAVLGEPLTPTMLSTIQSDITAALSSISNIVQVSSAVVTGFSLNTVNVTLTYSLNNTTITSNATISL